MKKRKNYIHTNSKTYRDFIAARNKIIDSAAQGIEHYSEREAAGLPYPVKQYLYSCGYISTPKANSMKAVFTDVEFLFTNKRRISIDYVQYNVVNKPARLAYIGSSIYGIPFEGLDSFVDGKASMKGILAGRLTIFNQRSQAMNKAALFTYLAECFLNPNTALQDFITWQDIDDRHVKATISCHGESASGIFSLNKNGEMHSFETNDREAIAANGESKQVKWSAVCGEYKVTDGIRKPTKLQAVWHYDEGDVIYFDSENISIETYPGI